MILPKIGLSRRKRLPTLYVLGGTFYPHQYVRFLPRTFGWRLLREEDDVFALLHKNQIIKLRRGYSCVTLGEWPQWERHYLPPFSLRGKTILDVGAGCGETAHFYLSHEARDIIAIECDPIAVRILRQNVKINDWPVKIIQSRFELNHLDFSFDFMKMDCEGCERELLKLSTDYVPPCVIEVHDERTRREFETRFGLELAWRLTETVTVLKKQAT